MQGNFETLQIRGANTCTNKVVEAVWLRPMPVLERHRSPRGGRVQPVEFSDFMRATNMGVRDQWASAPADGLRATHKAKILLDFVAEARLDKHQITSLKGWLPMPRGHKHPHYKLHGARVSWEGWTFWHWFKGGRMSANKRRHEIRTLSIDDVDFITREPPAEGEKVVLNIYLPEEAIPYVVRGVVRKIKTSEGKPEALVRVKFQSCPDALAIKIGDMADSVI